MAHMIESMAFANAVPWHGLGNQLEAGLSLEDWQAAAGMNWEIKEKPVLFMADSVGSVGAILSYPENKVLFRSDTNVPLSVVGSRYQVVQPSEILAFYKDLTEVAGYELETAGVLKGGKKLWALARTGQSSTLKGNDTVNGYLLLATACDGTLATTAQFTSIRVVCNNTLAVALAGGIGAVKVPHSTTFDPQAVKSQLGISVSSWDSFMYKMKGLSERKVKSTEAFNYFLRVFTTKSSKAGIGVTNERAMTKAMALYEGAGKGADLASSKATAFGLLNSITEFVDHERRAISPDYRLDSAWFGQGANLKSKALDQALLLID